MAQRRRLLCWLWGVGALALLVSPRAAADGDQPPTVATFARTTLPNGLTLLMSSDRDVPTVAVAVSYLAGTADDPPQQQGLGQLLARVMFAGSAGVPDGQHRRMIEAVGGQAQTYCGAETTSYVQVVPAHHAALALWLEAERMALLAIDPAAVARERAALGTERARQASLPVMEQARGRAELLALQGQAGYGRSPLADVATLGAAELRRFYEAHYVPAHAVVTVVGDFEPAAMRVAVERYFGGIGRTSTVATDRPGALTAQQSPRATSLRAADAQRGAVAVGWLCGGREHHDAPALEVAAELMGGGASSRAHALLVRERAAAFAVSASLGDERRAAVLTIAAELGRDGDAAAVAARIEQLGTALGRTAPPEAEVRAAARRLVTRWLVAFADRGTRARLLGEHQLLDGDAEALFERPRRWLAVAPIAVQQAAAAWLRPDHTTTVEEMAAPLPQEQGAP